ncbi:hypothetical protein C1645_157854 [Glomus cerebriforme]|uniref:DUF4112 domain-containing protein n=1 Tax=Glomus cerebriforme TaxID=658196 RepID=A0A397T0D5_9GLOM|nr:hypothetical protein C1645_157854 [Glomus cerebriforme]
MGRFSFFNRSQQDDDPIPPFITIDGKTKRNKWEIPASLNNEEKKYLIEVKKRAYKLDKSCCCGCCIGLDPLVGFLPIIGDFAGVILAFWLVNFIKNSNLIDNHKVPIMMREMTFMIVKDAMIGFFPIIGDLIDIFYKANTYNALVFQRYLVNQAKLRSVVNDNHKVEVITHNTYNTNNDHDNRKKLMN